MKQMLFARGKMKHSSIVIGFMVMLLVQFCQAQTCLISVSDTKVNSVAATYTVNWSGSSALTGTFLKINFQSVSNIPMPTVNPVAVPQSSSYVSSGTTAPISCTYLLTGVGWDLIIGGLVPKKSSYKFDISGITNPPSANLVAPYMVGCQLCPDAPCGTPQQTAYSIAGEILYSASVMSANTIYLTSSSQVNGAEGTTFQISVTLNQPLPIQGGIEVTIPKTNINYAQLGLPAHSLIKDLVSFGPYTTIVQWGTHLQPARTAIPLRNMGIGFSNPAIVYGRTITPNTDILNMWLDNPTIIPAFKDIDIIFNPCINPPSVKSITGFAITTHDGTETYNMKYIESSVGEYSFTTTTPGTFANDKAKGHVSKVEIEGNTNMVGLGNQVYKFVIYPTNMIPPYGKLAVFLPRDGWQLDCLSPSTLPKIECLFDSCQFSDSNVICDQATNSLLFLQGWPTAANFKGAGDPVHFRLKEMTNPSSTTTQYINVKSYNAQGGTFIVDEGPLLFPLTFATGKIVVSQIYNTDQVVYSSMGGYSFSMKFEHPCYSDYKLLIKVPSTLVTLQKAGCQIIGLQPSYECAADQTARLISIKGFAKFGEVLKAGDEVTFTIMQVIRNPGDFIAPGEFGFELLTNAGGKVDDGIFIVSNKTMYIPSFITEFRGTITDTTAGAKPVSMQFFMRPKAFVPQGAYIVLQIPLDFEPTNIDQQSQGCINFPLNEPENGFTAFYINCLYDNSTRNMTISNGFPTTSIRDPPTLNFTIPFWQNPRYLTKSTGMFNITIYTKDNAELYKFNVTKGPSFVIDKIQKPQQFSYFRSSYTNGEINNYTLTILPANYLEPGDSMLITMPYPVRFTENSKCIGVGVWFKGDMGCQLSKTLQNTNIIVQIFQKDQDNRRMLSESGFLAEEKYLKRRELQITRIPAESVILLELTKISSPGSLRPADGSIRYKVTTAGGQDIEALDEGKIVTNLYPALMLASQAGAIPSYMERGAAANYTISFTPINYERNMRIIIYFPVEITFPSGWNETHWGKGCVGIKGTSYPELRCEYNKFSHSLNITNALSMAEIRPELIEMNITDLRNPIRNIKTSPFRIVTETADSYQIDQMDVKKPMYVNFFCQFPCRDCNDTDGTQCFSCYGGGTPYIYMFDNKCLAECPAGRFEVLATDEEVATCLQCKAPCGACDKSATDCTTCIPGFVHFPGENTCYIEINWYFPFVSASAFFLVLVVIVDRIWNETNVTQALIPFLCLLECGVWGVLGWLYTHGEVEGTRTLSFISLGTALLLNVLFTFVHFKLWWKEASPHYKQVYKEFWCTSWFFQFFAYLLNFKISMLHISNFCGSPRFGGTFSIDSWQKFNLFSVLYVTFVYIPFMADFYLYFLANGLRQLTSYVALEAVSIMTIISTLLLLNILTECNCAGMKGQNMGKRAGLQTSKKKSNKDKRKDGRQGMANEEDYDSEEDEDVDELEELGYAEFYAITKAKQATLFANGGEEITPEGQSPGGPRSPRSQRQQTFKQQKQYGRFDPNRVMTDGITDDLDSQGNQIPSMKLKQKKIKQKVGKTHVSEEESEEEEDSDSDENSKKKKKKNAGDDSGEDNNGSDSGSDFDGDAVGGGGKSSNRNGKSETSSKKKGGSGAKKDSDSASNQKSDAKNKKKQAAIQKEQKKQAQKNQKAQAKQLDMLEQLASDMKKERDALEAAKEKTAKEEKKILKEKKKQEKEYKELKDGWAKEQKNLQSVVHNLKGEKQEILDNIGQRIVDKLGAFDGNPSKDLLGNRMIKLPNAVTDIVDYSLEINGDEEYWIQNATASKGTISDRSGPRREKDASLIEFVNQEEGQMSYDKSAIEDSYQQDQIGNKSGVFGEDVSGHKSMHASEMQFINRENASQGNIQSMLNRNATPKELLENASAIFSNNLGTKSNSKSNMNISGLREKEGTDIEQIDKKSAEFGSVTAASQDRKASRTDLYEKTDALGPRDIARGGKKGGGPQYDQNGISDESDEGIVANHKPFDGNKDGLEQKLLYRGALQEIDTITRADDTAGEREDQNGPSNRGIRRVKQVLYSDKSESSVDDMMDDTPSNYNAANGRLEGKSMGLKAILMFAKNQGIQLGTEEQQLKALGGLQQIQEEFTGTSNYQGVSNETLQNMKGGIQQQIKIKQIAPGMSKNFKEQSLEKIDYRDASQPRMGQNQDAGIIRKNNFV